jgi:predicted ArsR family transcriptional regulator
MLRNLLELLKEKGSFSPKDLAEALGESEEMVFILLEELEKRGAIRSQETCGSACEGCPAKTACKKEGGKVYFLRNCIKP